ncbi:hypothetical protein [Rathayibacter sp. AY1F7]|uniref:hypothetical protein n=1 Tax=Rathayibacter sp. AY1F7 TaxID=2080561 RepID=UPI0015E42AB4|nr:hypothetical protein [Rathayibacter sp. AY1F7]
MDLLHAYSKQSLGTPPVQSLVANARDSLRIGAGAPAVKRARQLRADEVGALVDHYRERGSVIAAAKALSITRQTAGKHLAEAGITTVRRMTEADVAAARSAHSAGTSATAIGRRLGFSVNTIIKALNQDIRDTGNEVVGRAAENLHD